MVGRTPEEAVDAFVTRIRSTLRCITDATAYASNQASPEGEYAVTLYDPGQLQPGRVHLLTHHAEGELVLRIALKFTVEQLPGDAIHGPYRIRQSFYQYRVLDYEDREILVYDWHPAGFSEMRAPHLHVAATGSILIRQRPGSRFAQSRTPLGSFHLPTGRVHLEDLVDLLIREFRAVPQHAGWEAILADNRAELERGQFW